MLNVLKMFVVCVPLSLDKYLTVSYLLLYLALICSVVVREDKRLLTVLFPDGRDGRAFTLKVHMLTFLLNSLMPSSKPKSSIISLMIMLHAL
jgi:hypothetical protein